MFFFPLIDHKSFEMAFVLSLKSSYNRKKEPIIRKVDIRPSFEFMNKMLDGIAVEVFD